MSTDRDGRATQAQMKKLLDLLSADGTLVDGRVVYTNTNKRMFWKRIAVQLNGIVNGVDKKFFKWCKMWADWKNKTKKKADVILRRRIGYRRANLSQMELRLLKLINYPVDDILRVLNEGKTYKKAQKDDNLNEDSDSIEDNFDDNRSDNEDNREHIYFADQDKMDSSDIFENDNNMTDNGGINIKIEENETSNNETLQDFKVKAQLALEKERINQKTEELKLKAIELKLKSDEMKLKETELGKVNYLTQLEEEKLKCMTEIAASLKELVEWTRNGSTRFHNVM